MVSTIPSAGMRNGGRADAFAGGVAWGGVFCGGLWVWLVWACAGEWTHNAEYRYGWLVPPLAVYFAAKRLASGLSGMRPPAAGVWPWMLLIVVALAAGVVELGRLAPLYWRVFPWTIYAMAAAATLLCAWLAGGPRLARMVGFPVLFMATGIPWPQMIESPVTQGLMIWIAGLLAELLPLAGVPAHAAGTTIVLPNCVVGVEEACSGLRSLQASLMISLAAGEFCRLGPRGRVVLAGIGVVFALVVNLLRTALLVFAGADGGEAAIERIHGFAAYGALGLLAAGIFVLAWLLRGRGGGTAAARAAADSQLGLPRGPMLVLCGVAAAGVLLAHGWYWARAGAVPPETSAPMLAWSGAEGTLEVPEKLMQVLTPSRAELLLKEVPGMGLLQGYHFFWKRSPETARQLYHRPDVCMPGGGWVPDGVAGDFTMEIGGVESLWHVLPFRREDTRAVLLWSAFLDGAPLAFDFHGAGGVQQRMIGELVRTGRRALSFETAAILIPVEREAPPPEVLRSIIRRFFPPSATTP